MKSINSFKRKVQGLAVAVALGAGVTGAMLPGSALAADAVWQWNYGVGSAASLNAPFTGEGYLPPFGPSPLSNPMDKVQITAESVIVWTGTPFAINSTFTDYILLRVDSFTLAGVTAQGPTYGSQSIPPIPVVLPGGAR